MTAVATVLALAATGIVLLLYLGLPLCVALRSERGDVAGARPCLVGLAVLLVFLWYWSTWSDGGARIGVAALLVLQLPLAAFVARRTWQRWVPVVEPFRVTAARLLRTLLPGLLASTVSTAAFLLHHAAALNGPISLPSSAGNNDLASYALAAQHLTSAGFDDAGRVAGTDFGTFAHDDVFGVYALLAAVAAVSGQSILYVLMPVLLIGLVLLALALTDLLHRLSALDPRLCGLVAGAASASPMAYYSVSHGFISHFYGSAAVFALFSVALHLHNDRVPAGWVPTFHTTAVVAAIQIALLMTYPHMALLAPPVVLTAVLLGGRLPSLRTERRRSGRTFAIFGCGIAVGATLIAPRSLVALERTLTLRGAQAGWSLDRVTVLDMLGLAPFPGNDVTAVAGSPEPLSHLTRADAYAVGAIVAILLVLIGLRRRLFVGDRRIADMWRLMAAILVIGTSCGVFYLYYGIGYAQWKWASTWQPLVLGATLSLICAAIAARFDRHRLPAQFTAMTMAAVALVAATVSWRTPLPLHIDDALRALPEAAQLAPHEAVNVDASAGGPPHWYTMWAAFQLSPHPVRMVSGSYFPAEPNPYWRTVRYRYEDGGSFLVDPARVVGPATACSAELVGPPPLGCGTDAR